MVLRLLREDGCRGTDGKPMYCEHPACILAWNTATFKALETLAPVKFIGWLQFNEADGEFGAQCCVEENRVAFGRAELYVGLGSTRRP